MPCYNRAFVSFNFDEGIVYQLICDIRTYKYHPNSLKLINIIRTLDSHSEIMTEICEWMFEYLCKCEYNFAFEETSDFIKEMFDDCLKFFDEKGRDHRLVLLGNVLTFMDPQLIRMILDVDMKPMKRNGRIVSTKYVSGKFPFKGTEPMVIIYRLVVLLAHSTANVDLLTLSGLVNGRLTKFESRRPAVSSMVLCTIGERVKVEGRSAYGIMLHECRFQFRTEMLNQIRNEAHMHEGAIAMQLYHGKCYSYPASTQSTYVVCVAVHPCSHGTRLQNVSFHLQIQWGVKSHFWISSGN